MGQNKKVRELHMDNGTEFKSTQLMNFLETNWIVSYFLTLHCPVQNGLAERNNGIVCEATRSLLFSAKLPPSCWVFAVSANVFRLNTTPCTLESGFGVP